MQSYCGEHASLRHWYISVHHPAHCNVQVLIWCAAGVISTCIVASRKHYSVDVLIAWYAVPLVFFTLHRRWTTKRSDDWPHRPLVNVEEETQLAEIVLAADDVPGKEVRAAAGHTAPIYSLGAQHTTTCCVTTTSPSL